MCTESSEDVKGITDWGSDARLDTYHVLSEDGIGLSWSKEYVRRALRVWTYSSEEKIILGRRRVGVNI